MSFKFNENLFKDEDFNEKIKQKLTNLLTKSLVKDDIPKSNSIYYDVTSSLNNSNSISSSTSAVTTTTTANNVIRSSSDKYNNFTTLNNNVGLFRTNRVRNSSTIISTGTNSANKSSSNSNKISNFLKDEIKITKVDFPMIPQVEILDMDITTEPRSLIKAIGSISCCNAFIQLETVIESNLLMATLQTSPSFITPRLIDNNSFKVPITMTFSRIKLEAITNVFMRNHGISISFNDVSLDFKFDCSIKILQNTIEKKLKNSIYSIFKEVLPTAIFNTSQHWLNPNKFNQNNTNSNNNNSNNSNNNKSKDEILIEVNKIVLDENDLQEISIENMARLASIIKSRYTLSLHGTNPLISNSYPNNFINFNGCLERQNLYRFISAMPSLQNFYHGTKSNNKRNFIVNTNETNATRSDSISYRVTESHHIKDNKIRCTTNNEKENYLPQDVLDTGNFELNDIINIQNKLYERNYHNSNHINNDTNSNIQQKNRVIRLNKLLKSKKNKKLKEETKEKITVTAGSKSIIYTREDNQEESFESKLSSETKEMNKFVDSLLTNPVNNGTNSGKASDSSLSSSTISKSIGFVGLNSYNSLWGYNNNINNSIIISTNDITISPTRRLSAHSIINMHSPTLSPPPYSY